MSSSALFIVLAAALCHAGWNVLAHGVSRIGVPFLFWGAVSSTVLWLGVVPFTGGIGSISVVGFVLGCAATGVLHLLYMVVLQRGYAVGNLSTVYATARGTGPTLSVVVAVLGFGERPSGVALLGVLAILVGVVTVGALDRRSGPVAGARVLGHRRIDPGLTWGLVTGVAIAAYTLFDAVLVRDHGAAPVAYMVGCTAVETVLFGVAAAGRRRSELVPVLRAHWGRVLLFGVLSPMSYILVLVAMTTAPVALVAPMRETSVVLVSLWGALVLREGRAGARVAAAAIVVGGIVLLAA